MVFTIVDLLHGQTRTAVILDKLPCYSHIKPGQRVIGFWPGRTRYYPGVVTYKRPTGLANCYQKAVYYVVFDDGDRRMQDFNQIRIIPCMTTETNTNESVQRRSERLPTVHCDCVSSKMAEFSFARCVFTVSCVSFLPG